MKAEPSWRRQAISPVGYIARFALNPLQLDIVRQRRPGELNEGSDKKIPKATQIFRSGKLLTSSRVMDGTPATNR